jgi:hypothetical protein
MRQLLGSFVVFSTSLWAACSDVSVDVRSLTELERAEARWDRFGPDSYVYAIRVLCFCPVEYTTPVRVRVENGVAVERTYVDSGMPVPSALEDQFPTVDGLFHMLRRAYADEADEVIVSYDPGWGYPTELSIDYELQLADEEIAVTVTEEPFPTPGP